MYGKNSKNNLTILLPISLKPTGGTSAFAQKFKEGAEKEGHRVIYKFKLQYDILLASPRAPMRYLVHAKLRNKTIIHRLDGVYAPETVAGWLYPAYNLPLRITRNHFANAVIYQSKYSQKTCREYLGRPPSKPTALIYNGVDTARFSPDGETHQLKNSPDQHLFISASRFRRKDQIIPLLDAFSYYKKKFYANSKLVVIGDFSGPVAKIPQTLASDSVVFTGIVTNAKLPEYLRSADVFLFTHKNPPCPNNVIEAMACGLPICGVSDGSMPELVTPNKTGELVKEEMRKRASDFSVGFSRNLNSIMQNKSHYKYETRKHAIACFSLQQMVEKYLNFIRSLT